MSRTIRILNVEDNEDDSLLIQREVRRAGVTAEFERVDSPEQLRGALMRDVWDLIIADYALPGFSGIEALEILNLTKLDIPFILVSGTVGEDVAVKAMKMGASDYILKGNLARLAPAIEREIREAAIRRERRRAETALKETDENLRNTVSLLRATIESTADGIMVVGVDSRITIRNKKFQTISGISDGLIEEGDACPVLDDLVARLSNPAEFAVIANHLCVRADSPTATEGFRHLEFKDGRHVEAFVVPQMLEGRCVGHVVCLRDITERLRAEEARHRIETQLFQSQKMEALGSLAGGVAHDFNNLLSVILNYAELLRVKVGGNADAERYVEHMLKAGQRAADLVRQILLFSRRQKQELRPLLLQDNIEDGLKLIRATIPRTVELNSSLQYDAPLVLADTTQVHQILMNLCINAAQAMPERMGRIAINVQFKKMTAEEAAPIPEAKAGEYVMLSVADNGVGMDAETLAHIFEPFFTTKAKGEGTGLGLAVVHGIIRGHTGFVNVVSTKGEGTTFSVYLPVYRDGTESHAVAANVEPLRGNGQHVLFVDDEPAICGVTEHVLRSLGYRVTTYTDPMAALESFKRDPRAVDLLLSDVNMPGMNGVELAKRFLALRRELPVLLISGFSGNWTPENVRPLGILDLLQKPISPRQIGTHLHSAFKTKRINSEPGNGAGKITFTKAPFSAK